MHIIAKSGGKCILITPFKQEKKLKKCLFLETKRYFITVSYSFFILPSFHRPFSPSYRMLIQIQDSCKCFSFCPTFLQKNFREGVHRVLTSWFHCESGNPSDVNLVSLFLDFSNTNFPRLSESIAEEKCIQLINIAIC